MAARYTIPKKLAGRSLLDALATLAKLPRPEALAKLRGKAVKVAGVVCTEAGRRVKPGQLLEIVANPKAKAAKPGLPPLAQQIVVRHVDDEILVVEKPAGLTTVRHADEVAALGGRAKQFLPPSLVDLLPQVLAARGVPKLGRLRAVHRLDKETTGLLVVARTPQAESALGKQLRLHAIERHYLALVRGVAQDARLESNLVRDRGDGRRGSGSDSDKDGQHAVTHVRVVKPLGALTLVECRLETGRTHQVRIHLGEAGTPLCGERIYDRPLHGQPHPDPSDATRPLLHAATLALQHPTTGQRMEWTSPLPDDMRGLVK